MEKPRVLFVASVARHLLAFHLPFIELLQGWGYEVHAACNPAGEERELEEYGVKVWSIPFRRSPWCPQNLWAFVLLLRVIAAQSYRLVHVHTPVASFLGRIAARLARVPAVLYTAHGFHFYRGAPLLNWVLYYPAEWICARWTDGLLVMNGEDHQRALGLPLRGHVCLVPGVGVPLDRFRPPADHARAWEGLAEGWGLELPGPVALYVGELSPNKNVSTLLRAWRSVAGAVPLASLLIVGDGPLRSRLQELVRELGLSRSVRFLGWQRDVERFYRVADVVVTVSRREGLPRTVLEAMASGCAVVASDVRGNRDLVKDGQTGLLVPVHDTPALAKAVLLLFGDKETARAMGRRAMAGVAAYDLKRVTTRMARIYSELGDLEEKDRAGPAPNQSRSPSS